MKNTKIRRISYGNKYDRAEMLAKSLNKKPYYLDYLLDKQKNPLKPLVNNDKARKIWSVVERAVFEDIRY